MKNSLEIAIVGADHTRYLDDLRKGLITTDRFSGVTSINARLVTPTLNELEKFDSVIVYNNYPYRDAKKLGDVLQAMLIKEMES